MYDETLRTLKEQFNESQNQVNRPFLNLIDFFSLLILFSIQPESTINSKSTRLARSVQKQPRQAD
jgi:hypothetical protein